MVSFILTYAAFYGKRGSYELPDHIREPLAGLESEGVTIGRSFRRFPKTLLEMPEGMLERVRLLTRSLDGVIGVARKPVPRRLSGIPLPPVGGLPYRPK